MKYAWPWLAPAAATFALLGARLAGVPVPWWAIVVPVTAEVAAVALLLYAVMKMDSP